MATSRTASASKLNLPPESFIGKPALRISKTKDWELGKIKEIVRDSDSVRAVFQKNDEGCFKRTCKKVIAKLGNGPKGETLDRIFPLIDVNCSGESKTAPDFGKFFPFGREMYFSANVSNLKITDDVLLIPLTHSWTDNYLPIGKVLFVGRTVDVLNKLGSVYIFVAFDNFVPGSERKIIDRNMTYIAKLDPKRLLKLGDYIEMRTGESESQLTHKMQPQTTFPENATTTTTALRPCKMTKRDIVSDHPVPLGTAILKGNASGKVAKIYINPDDNIYVAVTFDEDSRELKEYLHVENCSSEQCKTNLLIPMTLLNCVTQVNSSDHNEFVYFPQSVNTSKEFIKLDNTKNGSNSSVGSSQDTFSNNQNVSHTEPRSIPDTDYTDFYKNKNIARILTSDKNLGIQGENNSCYADSSLFALFAFTSTFDRLFSETIDKSKTSEVLQEFSNALKKSLYIPSSSVLKIRKILAAYDPRFLTDFMDAEEFLLTLFEECKIGSFIKLNNNSEDHIHQIIVPEAAGTLEVKEIKTLFEDSIWYSEVKLTEAPIPVLILKMPFCDGIPHFGSQYIIPNLQIQLGKSVMKFNSDNKQVGSILDLMAIICLKSNHYVCFARTGNETIAPWTFFDSNPVTRAPKIQLLEKLSDDLIKAEKYPGRLFSESFEHEEHLKFILQYCYICIYDERVE